MIVALARRVLAVALIFFASPPVVDAVARYAGAASLELGHALAAQSERGSFDQGLLWRVEKPGSDPSYLFGTVHLADKRVTALPPPVSRQLDAARSFTMEIALDPPNLAQLVARMIYDDARDLPTVAGAELFAKVVPLLADIGVPQELARRFRPWAVMLMLAIPPQKPEDVLDYTLHRIALQQNKTMHYLETVDDQVAAFEGMPVADQVAMLRHTIEVHGEQAALMGKLLDAYLQRDLGLMWRIGEASGLDRPDIKLLNDLFAQRLLFDRNARMVARMQPQIKTGGAFVAVGALHLYGDKGILSLLQRDGYRVSRIY